MILVFIKIANNENVQSVVKSLGGAVIVIAAD